MPELSMFLPLTKVDAANRLVYGLATAETPDRAGEVCDYASTKPFYEGGRAASPRRPTAARSATCGRCTARSRPARSRRSPSTTTPADRDLREGGRRRGVEEGRGGRLHRLLAGRTYAKRWRGGDGLMRYTADPSEVSLVDLPCLPSATFQVLKADGAAETRAFAESVRIAPPPEPDQRGRPRQGRRAGCGGRSAGRGRRLRGSGARGP